MVADDQSTPEALRVLVVDDNVDAATSLCLLLQMLGCETVVAFDGDTGVRSASVFRPHLAFFDLDMRGIDGCAAVQQLRASGEHLQAVFVCLTGRSEPDDRTRCFAAGFDHFITKPLEREALSLLLRACEGGRADGTDTLR